MATVQTSTAFDFYARGIFDGPCGRQTNHAITIVGTGNENGVDYWIARNSFGLGWGEKGYIRIQANGSCYLKFESHTVF